MKRLAFGVAAIVASLSGCATAKVVQKGPDQVVVSIPENTNTWPTHYREAADALAKQQLGPCKPVNEQEVVTGGNNAAGPTASVASASKEYRITYVKKPVDMGPPLPYGSRQLPPGAGIGAGMGPAPAGAYVPGSVTGASASTPNVPYGVVPPVGPTASAYQYNTPQNSPPPNIYSPPPVH
jgi:hypothetical protein